MPLSSNKTRYLENQSSDELFLTLEQVTELARYLNEKHRITIHVKGDLQAHGIEIKPDLLAIKHISFDEPVAHQIDMSEDEDDDDTDLVDLSATKEALIDILSIQHTLIDGQTVGYIYTSETQGIGHFECFIIRQNEIIKPQLWYEVPFSEVNNNVMAEVVCFSPWVHFSAPNIEAFQQATTISPSIAQADDCSCGSLCLATVKNLLKNGAQQLNDLTLQVPWLNGQKKIEYFFLASPQVLKYSQMGSYNASIKALFRPEIEGEDIYLIKHLKALIETLRNTTEPESVIGSYDLAIKHAQHLLHILPEFAKHWLSLFDISMAKRQLMKQEHNKYLSYTAYRYWIKSNYLYYDREFHLGDFIALSEHYRAIAISQEDYFKRMHSLIGPRDNDKVAYLLTKVSAIKPELAAIIVIAMLPEKTCYHSTRSDEYWRKKGIKESFNKLTGMCLEPQKLLIIEHVKALLPKMISRFFNNERILDAWFILCDLTSAEIKNYLEKNNDLRDYMIEKREKAALSSWLIVLSHYCYLTENYELPVKYYAPLYVNLISEYSETKVDILNQLLGAFTTSSLAKFFNAFPQLDAFLIDASVDLFFNRPPFWNVYNKEELKALWHEMNLFFRCSNNESLNLVQLKLSILLEPFVNFDLRLSFLKFLINSMEVAQKNAFFVRVFPSPIHQAGLRLTYLFPNGDDPLSSCDEEDNQSNEQQTKRIKIGECRTCH